MWLFTAFSDSAICFQETGIRLVLWLFTAFSDSTVCFQEIELGLSQMVLVGGTENMTQAPYSVRDIRFGTRFGQDLKVG